MDVNKLPNTIVVIEDIGSITKLLTIILRKAGFEVVTFETGEAACEWMRENDPYGAHAWPGIGRRPEAFRQSVENPVYTAPDLQIRTGTTLHGAYYYAKAFADGRLVGEVGASRTNLDFLDIATAWVLSGYRGRGISQRLYLEMAKIAAGIGFVLRSRGYQRSGFATRAWLALARDGWATETKDGRCEQDP